MIEAFKSGIDRTLLRENLKLTPAQRAEKFKRGIKLCLELRRVAQKNTGHVDGD